MRAADYLFRFRASPFWLRHSRPWFGDGRFDSPYRFGNVIVFPNHDEFPAFGFEGRSFGFVAFDIASNLRRPEVGITSRRAMMLRTAVPEAAANFHGDAGAREDYVDCHP